jgi:hypothetical protein
MGRVGSVPVEELETDTEEVQVSVSLVLLSIQFCSKARPLQVALPKKRTTPIWPQISDPTAY